MTRLWPLQSTDIYLCSGSATRSPFPRGSGSLEVCRDIVCCSTLSNNEEHDFSTTISGTLMVRKNNTTNEVCQFFRFSIMIYRNYWYWQNLCRFLSAQQIKEGFRLMEHTFKLTRWVQSTKFSFQTKLFQAIDQNVSVGICWCWIY